MTFRVGQRVICISEWDNESYLWCAVPRLNEVYTVRDLDDDGIRLVEIVNPVQLVQCTSTSLLSKSEPSFWCCNFRPVVEQKTDISCLTSLLVPGTKIREDA